MNRRGRGPRLAAVLLASAAMGLGWGPAAVAAPPPAEPAAAQTYAGPAFSADFPAAPTRWESQNKLWFHDGAWWALMADPTGTTVRVFELMPDHTWRSTPTAVNTDAADSGDALQVGDTVHVVTRHADGSLTHVRLSYDAGSRTYQAGAPTLVSTKGATGPASVTVDSTGRLWVGFATGSSVIVLFSDDGGQTWSANNALFIASTGLKAEVSGVVAYDNRVGILWSDQPGGGYVFASHLDGSNPYTWTREPAMPGVAPISHQIDLVAVPGQPSSTLLATVLVSSGSASQPPDAAMIDLLVRTPDGRWSTSAVSTVADGLSNPVLQLDPTTQTVDVYAASRGNIVVKRASLRDFRFPGGEGDPVVLNNNSAAGLSFPAVAREPISPESGVVILATDSHDRTYRDAELPVVPPQPAVDPTDHTPPTSPGALQGQAISSTTVVLSWTPSNDGTRWAAASDGVPVAGYLVTRNGRQIATVTATSVQDEPRRDTGNLHAATVTYLVQAVDASGNRSAPARVVVDLPPTASRMPQRWGLALLGVAALVGLVVGGRRLAVRRALRPGRETSAPPPADLAEKVPENIGS